MILVIKIGLFIKCKKLEKELKIKKSIRSELDDDDNDDFDEQINISLDGN